MSYRKHRYSSSIHIVFIALAAVVGVALLIGGYQLMRYLETKDYQPEQRLESSEIGVLRTIEFEGKTYRERTGLRTTLLIGVDNQGEETQNIGFRSGGQADSLILVVSDQGERKIKLLQIDRDTIAEVTVLSALGMESGTRNMQICLSHSFGSTQEQCCKYTVKAVENLLMGIEIDNYAAIDIDAIGILNDALGGVTVPIEDDFSQVDPNMVFGTEVKLDAQQAEYYVRGRMAVADGTNSNRMKRQRTFMNKAADLAVDAFKKDNGFADKLIDKLGKSFVTDMVSNRITTELTKIYEYDREPIATFEGEHTVNAQGFMEFHADETSIMKWIVGTFFEEQ